MTMKRDNDMSKNNDHRIAVIGLACRFPCARNVKEFWDNLVAGKNSVSVFSEQQLEKNHIAKALSAAPNYVKARGVVDDIYCFDAEFFGLSPYEAKEMDPQQRVFLEVAWSALEDAGYAEHQNVSRIGVYTGMSDSTYLQHNLQRNKLFLKNSDPLQQMMSTNGCFLSSHVSYLLNLRGPSININTACSTSLVTVVSACKDLVNHDCDIAIAGGVSLFVPQESGYLYQKGSVFSPDGVCRAFDAAANGIVRSNGCGAVILKRFSEAVRDRDHIEAVILGYAINNDGADKAGYAAPSISGQVSCVMDALSMANISSENIDYVEAHGTGTPLGDLIEITALSTAFRKHTSLKSYCAIGSVKTNIGHTDVASGIAGFIKAVLSIKHGIIVPSLYFNKPNPKINFSDSPFFVNTILQGWPKHGYSRKASVNSLGMGGTNAHVVIKQALDENENQIGEQKYYLLPFSTKTEKSLEKAKENLRSFLKEIQTSKPNCSMINNIAYTLQKKRKHFSYRDFILVDNMSFDIQNIKKMPIKPLNTNNQPPALCFVFSGEESKVFFICQSLYERFSVFKQCVDLCSEKLSLYINLDLKTLLFPSPADKKEAEVKRQQTQYMQPAIFTIEYALTKLLESLGIRPSVMIGMGIGEYVAAHLAGIFSLEDALKLVAKRAEIILGEEPCATRAISLNQFRQELENVDYHPSQLPIISSSTGEKTAAIDLSCAEYWFNQFQNTVLSSKVLEQAYQLGCYGYVNIGSGNMLKSLIQLSEIDPKKIFYVPTLLLATAFKADMENTEKAFFNSIGKLWQQGIHIHWNGFENNSFGRTVSLPTYPFQKIEHVVLPDEPNFGRSLLSAEFSENNKTLGYYKPVWIPDVSVHPNINALEERKTWLLFLDDIGLGSALGDLLNRHNQRVIFVTKGKKYTQKSDDEYTLRPGKKNDYQKLFKSLGTLNLLPKYFIHLFSLSVQTSSRKKTEQSIVQREGFYSLVYFAQTFLSKNSQQSLEILVVSNHIKKIFHQDTVIPEKATILGPCVAMPQEYPLAKLRFIDIDYSKSRAKRNAEILLVEARRDSSKTLNDTVVGYRNQQRFVQSFQEIFVDDEKQNSLVESIFKKNGIYLITGGLGQLGLQVAKMISKQAPCKLILIGHSLFPQKEQWDEYLSQENADKKTISRILSLREIEEAGSKVYVYSFNLGEFLQSRKLIYQIQKELGDIIGIIHAAGVTGNPALSPMSAIRESFVESQFSAKMYGLSEIMNAVDIKQLDFCVLFSSLASFIGGKGFSTYAASNQFLNAFAAQQLNSHRPGVISINWDIWNIHLQTGSSPTQERLTPNIEVSHGLQALQLILKQTTDAEVIVSDYQLLAKIHYLNQFAENIEADKKIIPIKQEPSKKTSFQNTETRIADIFKQCLGIEKIEADDDFYELGGNSLSALRFAVMLGQEFNIKFSVVELLYSRTVRKLTALIDQNQDTTLSPLVILRSKGNKPPLFLFHPVNGSVSCYFDLAKNLDMDRPIIGVQDITLNKKNKFSSFEEMAGFYLTHIRKKQPKGPYLLAGVSLGGNLAYEVAKQFNDQGEQISFLGLLDSWALFSDPLKNRSHFMHSMQKNLTEIEKLIDSNFLNLNEFLDLIWHRMELLCQYKPESVNTKVILFKAMDLQPEYALIDDPFNHWSSYVNQVDLEFVSGGHETMLKSPHVEILAKKMKPYLRKTDALK